MNAFIQDKAILLPLLIAGVLACFGFLPGAQAVVPAPDGGYPGQNTAEGQNALLSLTTGTNNTAVGWFSLKTLTTGQYNTALGSGALFSSATSNLNTATGAAALFSNTSGFNNTAHGALSLFHNTTGGLNTANGFGALSNHTTGFSNTANGVNALALNTTGSANTASGSFAGASITGDGNVCIGAGVEGVAGENNSTWIRNINTTLQSFVGVLTITSLSGLATADLGSPPSFPRDATKRTSSRWTRPAKRSWRSNR